MMGISQKNPILGEAIITPKDPLVSVLVPSYNHEKYIIGCLESIKSSDYANLELILLDDGSVDRTYVLAQSWIAANRQRFSCVECSRQENAGISKTLNRLIASSRGEYLSAVASDDELLPAGISSLVACALKNNAGLVLSDAELIDEDGGLISPSALDYFGKSRSILKKKWLFDLDVLIRWNPPYQYQFIKKSIYDELGGYNHDYRFEDRDFCLKAMFKTNLVLCENRTWRYRIRLLNRVTPGLLKDEILSDLQLIHSSHICHARGLNRLILGLIVLSGDKKKSAILKTLLAKTILNFLRHFLKSIYWWDKVKTKIFS